MRALRVLGAVVGIIVLVTGVAYAASTTLTSKKLTVLTALAPPATAAPPARPKATAVKTDNFGSDDGKPEPKDTVTVTFSDTLAVTSICNSWTDDAVAQSIAGDNVVTVTIENNTAAGGNDRLVVTVSSAACNGTFNFGSVNLDADGYVTSTTHFKGASPNQSQVAWDPAAKQLKVTLGAVSSGEGRNVSANRTAVYTPDPDLKATNGQSTTTDTASSPNEKQF